jgi:hypothetical protein
MQDSTLKVAAMEVVPAEDHIQLVIMTGLDVPVGPGQAMRMIDGVIRVPMGREPAIEHGRALVAAGEAMEEKKETDLVVANSLAGVEEAAKTAQKFRGQDG